MDRRIVKLRAEGRAVIDTKSYRRMNPSRQQNMWDDAGDDFQQEDDASPGISGEVPHEDLCLLPPTMHGFSLVCRDWGELLIVSGARAVSVLQTLRLIFVRSAPLHSHLVLKRRLEPSRALARL